MGNPVRVSPIDHDRAVEYAVDGPRGDQEVRYTCLRYQPPGRPPVDFFFASAVVAARGYVSPGVAVRYDGAFFCVPLSRAVIAADWLEFAGYGSGDEAGDAVQWFFESRHMIEPVADVARHLAFETGGGPGGVLYDRDSALAAAVRAADAAGRVVVVTAEGMKFPRRYVVGRLSASGTRPVMGLGEWDTTVLHHTREGALLEAARVVGRYNAPAGVFEVVLAPDVPVDVVLPPGDVEGPNEHHPEDQGRDPRQVQ